jgi:hypothetical protein
MTYALCDTCHYSMHGVYLNITNTNVWRDRTVWHSFPSIVLWLGTLQMCRQFWGGMWLSCTFVCAYLYGFIELFFYLNRTFCWELVPHDLLLVVLHTISINSFYSWCMLGIVFELEWRAPYFGSWRTKPILAPLSLPKWVWPSKWIDIECSSLKPSHYLQACNKNFINHGRCCIQNNQPPIKSQVELEESSNNNNTWLLFTHFSGILCLWVISRHLSCHLCMLQTWLGSHRWFWSQAYIWGPPFPHYEIAV